MKVINLLCKGRSLANFSELPEAQLLVLTNDFDRELLVIPSLYDYVYKHKLHLVLNMAAGGANGFHEINFFQKFNVDKLIRPYLEGIRTPGSSGQNIPLEDNFLGKHHMDFMQKGGKYPYDYSGTGIAAFAHTILDCSADIINVIGMDFYDNLNYGISNYLSSCAEGRDYKRDHWTREQMQEHFCKLVKSKPNIQVNMITSCKTFINEMYEIKNLNIKKRGMEKEKVETKKLAVVVGGWHYPYEFYNQIKAQKIPDGWEVDYFIVSHRDPELPIVFDEKQPFLKSMGDGVLQSFDKELYSRIVTKQELSDMGFIYNVEESSIGDIGQLRQWVDRHYKGQYDKVLFTHDDNYMLSDQLFIDTLGCKVPLFSTTEPNVINKVSPEFDWKHMAAGQHVNTIVPRFSFCFLDSDLLNDIQPHLKEIVTKGVNLDRTGETSSLSYSDGNEVSRAPLSEWNTPTRNFINWMTDNNYGDTSVRLSTFYRVTKYFIEGERGFIWTEEGQNSVINNLAKYYDIS